MRNLLLGCAISVAILAGNIGIATAQALQEVFGTDTIELKSGQVRTFAFDQPVGRFSLSSEGIAQITPETDRTFTIQGIKPGQVLMTAYAQDGHVVHRSMVSVEQTRGLVKIYGHAEIKDYVGYYCTRNGCRADPDVGARPHSPLVSETQQKGSGENLTTTREPR